jgi:hypothetical protein
MLFELYYRNYATEGDVDLNEFALESEPRDELRRGPSAGRLESLAAPRPARKTHDARTRKPLQKRKDGLSL